MAAVGSSSQNKASDFSSSVHKGATFIGTLHKGPESSYKYFCLVCEENGLDHEAFFYCQECHKSFCNHCVEIHKQLYTKHTVLGTESLERCSVIMATMDSPEHCKEHADKKLELFCEDHDTLICYRCLLKSHKRCTERVVLIDDKVNKMQHNDDFTKLTEKINELTLELTRQKQFNEDNFERLQNAYKEELHKITTLRKTVNETLDSMEKRTIETLNSLLDQLKAPLQDDIDKCIDALSRMKKIHDEMKNIENNTKVLTLILYRKCLEKSSAIESEKSRMVSNRIPTIKLIPDPFIERTLSLSSFGKFIYPNEIIKVTGKTKHNIKRWGDFYTCMISDICETDNGKLLIIDRKNEAAKLLDKDFKVASFNFLPHKPMFMCSIAPSLFAVTLDNSEVVFIIVAKNGQMVQDRTLKLQHNCLGIAHYQGNLYITSGTALYHYTVRGRLVSKIYQDKSSDTTVESCAISQDGTSLYVSNSMKLVTLLRDGTVINVIHTPDIRLNTNVPPSLHCSGLRVTDSGQVLVCRGQHTIFQVDGDGRQKLVELVTEKDGVKWPTAVYYSKTRASLIVGMVDSDFIWVFKT